MPKPPAPENRVNSTAPAKPDGTTDGADAASKPSSKTKAAKPKAAKPKAAKPKAQASPLREPVANAWKRRREIGRREIDSAIEGNELDALSRLFSASEEWSRKMAQWAPDGQTALMFAADEARPECVRLLLPFSEALASDSTGETALMKAARARPFFRDAECEVAECVRLLLPHSDPSARNRKGQTAIAFAVRSELGAVADLLAPFSPHEDTAKAFEHFKREGMPAWAAKLEADELAAEAGLANGSDTANAEQPPRKAARL